MQPVIPFSTSVYLETSDGCMVSSNSTCINIFQVHLWSEILKNAAVLYHDNGGISFAFVLVQENFLLCLL